MKKIKLDKGYVVLIDDDDYDKVQFIKWEVVQRGKNNIYAANRARHYYKTTTIYMHRLILGAQKGQQIDHIDGNGLNNQKSNLRFCNTRQNCYNTRSKGNKLGFKGVQETPKGRFTARIKFMYKGIYIGVYDTVEEAARAYDKEAIKLFGEFARTNFPKECYQL